MQAFHPRVRRVTVVVLDGLRPDAIESLALFTISRIVRRGASTMRGRAVSPSVTAAAMATLLTGASPERHGLQSDRFQLPRSRGLLHPWPRLLRAQGLETTVLMARIPSLFMPVARGFSSVLGVNDTRFAGDSCVEIAAEARQVLRTQATGVALIHFPDADRAGHERGWMSAEYCDAARRMDGALAQVLQEIDLDDGGELVMLCADHGGGGTIATAHDSSHPLDTTIPVILAGGRVHHGELGTDVDFADLPATLVWSLGLPIPATYAGRALAQAFQRSEVAA